MSSHNIQAINILITKIKTKTKMKITFTFPQIWLAAIVLFCLSACNNENGPNKHNVSTVDPQPINEEWWTQRHNTLKSLDKSSTQLLFLGDSITHRWEEDGIDIWQQYFEQYGALNMGFNGDKTQNLLWRINDGALKGMSPKYTILLIGTNNVSSNTALETSEGIIANILKITEELPKTNVIVVNLFPRGTARSSARRFTQEVNELLNDQVLVGNIELLNINDIFLDNKNEIPLEIMADGLHLTAEGYQIWADEIYHITNR